LLGELWQTLTKRSRDHCFPANLPQKHDFWQGAKLRPGRRQWPAARCAKASAKIEVGIGMSEKELRKRLTDAECRTLFASLFPAGFAGKDVLEEIAPEGWPDSTLQFVFHPILEQVHWERMQLHRNLRNCKPRRPALADLIHITMPQSAK
jgi:hypothetical protein